jgi:L-ascorbate metabolism protein UlaG (beta-lactamase superfamily)
MDGPLRFRWLGVAGFELATAEHVLAIDPYLTRISFWRQWFGRVEPDRQRVASQIPGCDWVLVTHAHWDHLADVPAVLEHTGAVALGSANACRLLALLGVPEGQVRQIGPGDRLSLGPFRVRVLLAKHIQVPGYGPDPLARNLRPPLRAREYRMDVCFCFLIEVSRHRLLTDPGECPDGCPRAEVLLVSTYQEEAYYQALLCLVAPRVVIPSHWDDLWRPLSKPVRPMLAPPRWAWPPLGRIDLDRFRQVVEKVAPGTQVFVPERFATYELGGGAEPLQSNERMRDVRSPGIGVR